LNTILKIDFLHHIGGGADKKTRNEHLTLQSKNKATKGKKDIELANCQEINKQFSYDKITEVYLSSQAIDRRSIIDFFESTCELALERVDQMEFFEITQKIAQCVELNNSRPYEEWQAIFEVISRYYILIIKRCKEKGEGGRHNLLHRRLQANRSEGPFHEGNHQHRESAEDLERLH
jgi:hypothetical protein